MTLPAFLLAWSERNWFWCFAKLCPAREARWTLARTLGLAALAGSLGALLGLGLALALFHHPAGWMPWLLGLWFTCIGLCWFGLTGLCWNQRARRLRDNPTLAPILPKSRFPFLRWGLGLVYFVLLGVLTPLALVITVENLRSELAWKRERARLTAQGEPLTFRAILGPEIPAEQNAGAASIFAPFFDYSVDTTGKAEPTLGSQWSSHVVWNSSNELAHLEMHLKTPSEYLPTKPKQPREKLKTPLNISDWSAAYRQALAKPKKDDALWAAPLKLPAPGDPARDVLAGLAGAEPELAAICAAATLPRAQFPIHYEAGFDTLLRHLGAMKAVQQTLRLRCAAHLAAGETDAAFADATNALNVAELLREEPLLISQLVRYSQCSLALDTLWQGFPEHRWSEAQLAVFQERLARLDYLPGFIKAFEGERACGLTGMEQLIANPPGLQTSTSDYPAPPRILKAIPRGMLRQNQVTLARFHQTALTTLRLALTNSPSGNCVALPDPVDEQAFQDLHVYSPYTVLTAMIVPAFGRANQRVNRTQTTVQLAVVACALERYHLAQGQFPPSLEELTPRFLAKVPTDPMAGEPFHYRRTEDGWYLLYSVGPNRMDDGGVLRPDQAQKEDLDWPWPVPTRPGRVHLF